MSFANSPALVRRGLIVAAIALAPEAAARAQAPAGANTAAAAFTDYLLRRYGAEPLQLLWRKGSNLDSAIAGSPLRAIERDWRKRLTPVHRVENRVLDRVESRGCG